MTDDEAKREAEAKRYAVKVYQQLTTGTVTSIANNSSLIQVAIDANERFAGTPPAVAPKNGTEPLPVPVKLLASWREILIALGMKNNREDKQKVSRLNKTYNGPIVIPGAGKQPIADRAKLIEWWNRLEIELHDRRNQARGTTADAESQHDYGRTGKAAPGIGGGVKRRRKDRKP